MSSGSAPDKSPPEAGSAPPRILLYGYGNPGRQDDGAGVVLVEELATWGRAGNRPWLTFDTNYQLNAEDALAASKQDVVIFADASRDQPEGFRFQALHPAPAVSFSTHAMTPESVLALALQLYGANPAAYMLSIRGFEWEPNGVLTGEARKNVDEAKAFITQFLDNPSLRLPSAAR